MLTGLSAWIERRLPKGRIDLLCQVSLFCGAYLVYRLVEGAADHNSALALAHATQIISLEQSLGVFVEPSIQSWASGSHLLMVLATYVYVTAQTAVLLVLLLYFYLVHNRHYYFLRNMLLVGMAIGLVGYLFFPTMPPRFLPNWGFVDTVSNVTGVSPTRAQGVFINPYAAVPSMHVAFALMFGWTLVRVSRTWAARIWWACWPALITFVTIITANHFLLDAVLGALTAAVAAAVALRLARVRPHLWAFAPAPAAALAPAPAGAQVAVS
jgi:membrane-associated phospholipid phosphatase